MVRVEEAADQEVGFEGAAMVRSPVKALQLGVCVHHPDVGGATVRSN
jgi:hypothetical protein